MGVRISLKELARMIRDGNVELTDATDFDALAHSVGEYAHKYGAEVTTVDGIRFDSRKEANRYSELLLLEREGEIFDLRRQVHMGLHTTALLGDGTPVRVGYYIADFVYRTRGMTDADVPIVEDSKGMKTDMYRMKKRWVLLEYGIDIKET